MKAFVFTACILLMLLLGGLAGLEYHYSQKTTTLNKYPSKQTELSPETTFTETPVPDEPAELKVPTSNVDSDLQSITSIQPEPPIQAVKIDPKILKQLRYSTRVLIDDIEMARPLANTTSSSRAADSLADANESGLPFRLIGHIKDKLDTPLSGITVIAKPIDGFSSPLNTVSNEQGFFELDVSPDNTYQVCNQANSAYQTSCTELLAQQDTLTLIVEKQSSAITVYGTIRSSEKLETITGAKISISNIGTRPSTLSDRFGNYHLTFSPEPSYNHRITISSDGYDSQTLALSEAIAIDNQQRELDIFMLQQSGHRVTGRVLDKTSGNGIAGQNIALFSPSSGWRSPFSESNENGVFSINNVPAGQDYQLSLYADDTYQMIDSSVQTVSVPQSSKPLQIFMQTTADRSYSLVVSLRSVIGQPIPNRTLTLDYGEQQLAVATTNSAGEAFFKQLPKTNLSLFETSIPVTVTNLTVPESGKITITAGTGEENLNLQITNQAGLPVKCNQLLLRWQRRKPSGHIITSDRWLRQDESGNVLVSGLPAARHQLMARRCPGYQRKLTSLDVGSQTNSNIVLDEIQ